MHKGGVEMGDIIHLFKGGNMMKGDVTIFDVANYFLSKLNVNEGSSITPLKLQKLVYYAQAWSLVWDDKPLFNEPMEAWAHGPVNSELYNEYKSYGWRGIDPVDGADLNMFTEEQLETMDAVWDGYGDYDGKYLERLTHQEDPWIEARRDCLPGEFCANVISMESMKVYYTKMYNGEI